MLGSISSQDIQLAGVYLVTLVLSIAVHEYFHALAADRLGDGTPEGEGRLTLNPIVHADLVGTLALPILAAIYTFPLIGWGKPVNTQPSNYTRRVSMRTGMGIVAVAGPIGNLVLAAVCVLVAAVANVLGVLTPVVEMPLRLLLQVNIVLMVLNLLPLHPLDGAKVLGAVLPTRLEWVNDWILRFGPVILIALLFFGSGLLAIVFEPFVEFSTIVWQFAIEVTS